MSNQYPPTDPGSEQPGQPPSYQPPSYPPPPPGAPGGYGGAGGYGLPQQSSPLAIVSLVLGILALPCCTFFVLGVGAVVTGFVARRQIAESQGRYKGAGMAMAGMVLGAIAIVLAVAYYVLVLTGTINTDWEFNVG